MSNSITIFEKPIKEIVEKINKEIIKELPRRYYDKDIKSFTDIKDTSRNIKENIMSILYQMFNVYHEKYYFQRLKNNIEHKDDLETYIEIGEYRCVSALNKFYVKIKFENKYIEFDIQSSNIKLKKTKEKIGSSCLYEVSEKTFNFEKLYINCYKYIWPTYDKRYLESKLDFNLSIKENLNLF